jgi:integrase/recombinase XerC
MKYLTDTELEKLLLECGDNINVAQLSINCLRRLVIIRMMAQTGLRVGELVQLRFGDIAHGHTIFTTLRVGQDIAKRGRERLLPLRQSLQDLLAAWLEACSSRFFVEPDSFLFWGCTLDKHLTTRQVERIVANAGAVYLGIRLTPHMLRHTFATRALAVSNTRIVQTLLGHKHLSSTEIYTHPNGQDLKNVMEKI